MSKPAPESARDPIRESLPACSLRRFGGRVAAVLLYLTVGGAFGYGLAPHQSAARSPPLAQHAPPTSRPAATSSTLDALRQGSLLGDDAAAGDLAALLLDRFDLDGDSDDLFEAVVWIDRNLYAAANVALAKRVSSRYCDHRAMQWHAMCQPGE